MRARKTTKTPQPKKVAIASKVRTSQMGTLRDIPSLSISSRIIPQKPFNHRANHKFHYEATDHSNVPHVVKFSGGRSSGMLLFMLLENGILKRERGDVVIFNNTSAEHLETYLFSKHCKRVVEEEYGIPFFWIEFQTYEDVRNGEWTRQPTYRLVNEEPQSKVNPDGYSWKGEVFEEMLSWRGYVPNQFSRVCTKSLKLEVTRAFLQDWFACKDEIEHQGHYRNKSRLEDEMLYQKHLRNGGSVPRDIFLKKKSFVRERATSRPQQKFADFSSAFCSIENPDLAGKQYGGKALWGSEGIEYAAFVGLRYDEMNRVVRMRTRNSETIENNQEGEHVYMPLASIGVTRADVDDFWAKQEWGLNLPPDANLSNCVYCFLKGAKNLRNIHSAMSKNIRDNGKDLSRTPSDIKWWKRIESIYGRDLKAEKRKTKGTLKNEFIGFFGNSQFSYKFLDEHSGSESKIAEFSETLLPCDCTD